MYPVDLKNNEKSCEYSAIQYVAKSIATGENKSLYNQPKQCLTHTDFIHSLTKGAYQF
jgi:hypothetical protein